MLALLFPLPIRPISSKPSTKSYALEYSKNYLIDISSNKILHAFSLELLNSNFFLICSKNDLLKPGKNLDSPIQRRIVDGAGKFTFCSLKKLYAEGIYNTRLEPIFFLLRSMDVFYFLIASLQVL